MNTESLNENQKKAVLSNAKHLRIIAGAGSGKTRVLTMHIVHLIEDEDVFPQHILAITFTNKAANEMKDRVAKMLGEGHANPFISTIHALCVRILREDIAVIGWPRNFTIVDAEDQKSIVKDAYKNMDWMAQSMLPVPCLPIFLPIRPKKFLWTGQRRWLAAIRMRRTRHLCMSTMWKNRKRCMPWTLMI